VSRESAADSKKRARRIARKLHTLYPDAETALDHASALELLVATILSAQCTDARVNQVTPRLFRDYRTAADYAEADVEKLEDLIRSTGFFRQKTRSLVKLGKGLVDDFGGEVPNRLEDLVKLPGIGRKTANVVLGTWFGIPGITVDTHVKRLAGRLGLTRHTDPVKIEFDLMELLPKKEWTFGSHALIWHGRRVCKARKPACTECGLAPDCPWPSKTTI
jgi:endonuclease-3